MLRGTISISRDISAYAVYRIFSVMKLNMWCNILCYLSCDTTLLILVLGEHTKESQ